jgi:hypothetical protein
MSRKRGRPSRQYRVGVHTVRRDPIDYAALARAALEHAAAQQHEDTAAPLPVQSPSERARSHNDAKDVPDDGLA